MNLGSLPQARRSDDAVMSGDSSNPRSDRAARKASTSVDARASSTSQLATSRATSAQGLYAELFAP